MGNRTPAQARFVALRRAYEDAFRQFSLQVRLLQSLASRPVLDERAVEEARRRVQQAHFVYRERRDLLAGFMLSREMKAAAVESLAGGAATQWGEMRHAAATDRQGQAETADIGSEPLGSARDLDQRSQVERLAYRLWEEAGRPSGMAEEHLHFAERLLQNTP
jgi:hypothetical protein